MIYCVLVIQQQNSFIGLGLMLIFIIGRSTSPLSGSVLCVSLFFFSETVPFTCFLKID